MAPIPVVLKPPVCEDLPCHDSERTICTMPEKAHAWPGAHSIPPATVQPAVSALEAKQALALVVEALVA